jgi:hypothetical protein
MVCFYSATSRRYSNPMWSIFTPLLITVEMQIKGVQQGLRIMEGRCNIACASAGRKISGMMKGILAGSKIPHTVFRYALVSLGNRQR